MKTEKRLTMALSVLVALMMLAVPLASSSNLFVDGGQTNSNGDAPSLGASAVADIKDVWIVNDKTSFDKVVKLDCRSTMGDNGLLISTVHTTPADYTTLKTNPWVAIAFTVSEDTNALAIEVSVNNDTGFVVRSASTMYDAGKTYVITAYLGNGANDEDQFNISSDNQYGTYDVTLYQYPNGTTVSVDINTGGLTAKDANNNAVNPHKTKSYSGFTYEAPAKEGVYTLTFDLHIDENSLDYVLVDTTKLKLEHVTFTYNEEKNIITAIVDTNAGKYSGTIGKIIEIINSAVSRTGYILENKWSSASGAVYDSGSDGTVGSNLSLASEWTPDSNYILITYESYKDKESQGTYTKSYKKNSGTGNTEYFVFSGADITNLEKLFDLRGFVVNSTESESFPMSEHYNDIYADNKGAGVRDVFALTLTDSNGKEVVGGKTVVKENQTFTINIDLDSAYYKIEVYSKMFEKSLENGIAVLYAFGSQPATFDGIFNALQELDSKGNVLELKFDGGKYVVSNETDDRLIYKPQKIDKTEEYYSQDKNWHMINFIAENDSTYTLNNTRDLIYDDNYESGRGFELNAEIMGYTIIFMVNGEYEIVNVPYKTALTNDLTSLDIEGLKNWVAVSKSTGSGSSATTDYNGYAILNSATITLDNFKVFNFTTTNVGSVEEQAKQASENGVTFALVLVANFQDANDTSYAIFDANDYAGKLVVPGDKTQDTTIDDEKVANFGNELVTKIVISGKTGNKISTLPANPVILDSVVDKDKFLYLNWFLHSNKAFTSANTFSLSLGTFGDVDTNGMDYISADWEKYKNTITFHVDGKVNGIFYYRDVNSNNASDDDIKDIYDLVAFTYGDKLYASYLANMDNSTLDYKSYGTGSNVYTVAATDAFAHVLDPFKAGHYLDTWTDAPSNGNKMIDDVNSVYIERNGNPMGYIVYDSMYQWFDKLTESADFYANFLPLGYKIAYNSNSADAPNSVYQIGFADVSMKLLGEKTFSNDKSSTLTSWNDRSDNAGKTYALGADFKLTGEQLDAMGITAYNTDMKDFAGKEAGQTIPAGSAGITGDLTFFGIWAFNTDGGSGDSSSGGDDNTNTYILIGILLVIIILIIVMIVLMRNKN